MKNLLFTTFLMALGFFSCSSEKSKKENLTMKNAVTEVVIYQLKTEKLNDYADISKMADTFLKTRKGFISRRVMQDHKDPAMFIDIVEWEKLEDALGAVEAVQKEEAMIPFLEAFDKINSFNHFEAFQK